MKIESLKRKIKQLEDYLGPRVNYTTDRWPDNKVNKWLMEYMILLKNDYYRRFARRKK